MRATTAQLYPGRDAFGFDLGYVTKKKPLTVLILSRESHNLQVRSVQVRSVQPRSQGPPSTSRKREDPGNEVAFSVLGFEAIIHRHQRR